MDHFEKYIGYENIKKELYKLCDIITNPQKYIELGAKMPKGLLLHGVPGVGKTLLAECFIKACGINCYVCRKDKDDVFFVEQIAQTFEKAKQNAPSIVFLDDMDKFANEDRNNANAPEYVTIQSCIDNVKNSDVFVVATANETCHFPSSLTRAGRFDIIIEIDTPNDEECKKIIEYYLSQKKYVSDIDVDEIAKLLDGRSCAELESVINCAGIIAGFANKKHIETSDIISATLKTIYRFEVAEKNSENPRNIFDEWGEYNQEYKVALHEAGHVVLAEILNANCVNLVAVSDKGLRKGFVSCYHSKKYAKSERATKCDCLIGLAGKAAIDVVCAEVDKGCTNDVYEVMRILERHVECCAEFGFDKIYLGHGKKAEKQNSCIAVATEMYYALVKKLLVKNMEFLKQVALELFDKKLLFRADIQKIKQNYKIKGIDLI